MTRAPAAAAIAALVAFSATAASVASTQTPTRAECSGAAIGSEELYVVTRTGRGCHAVNRTLVQRPFAAVAPARDQLATFGADRQLVITDLVGGHVHPLRPRNVMRVRWSPDGRALALVIAPPCAAECPPVELWTIGSDGRGLRKLAIAARDPVWSPDSRRIAFVRQDRGTGAVVVMDVDGTGARELAPWKQPKFYAALGGDEESDLAWSPRGGSIAYSTGADDRIHVVRLSDRRDRALAPGVAPRWSPSGRLIAFLHVDRVDEHFPLQWSLRVVGASGGRLRSLATGQDVALHTWSPRGEIAFAARSSARGNQLYTVSLRRRVRVLTREPKSTLYRALFWSRGGRRVFYDAYVPDDV